MVVREYVSSRVSWYPLEASPPLEGVVPASWENIVTEKDSTGETRVNRLTYELSHLPRLKTEILRRWGVIGLLDMLKESAMLTGCLDCFQSTGSREALDPEVLQKRLLLCMYGMGTNMGLKRMAGVDPNITVTHSNSWPLKTP
jgi:hypothetical protein